ncbi:MAG: hypothetical protein IJV69_02015, partial [Kiritimatiellae bacterium]|nr:hypothetical protein [Kiritimatiellia bacterium]
SKRSSCLFAFSLTCSTKITSFLAGQVDYTAYAALMTAILSLALWVKSMTLRNLITLGVGLIFCMTSKTTGFICGFLLLGIGCISSYRCTKFWFFAICTMGIVLLIGAAPLLTAWIQYGAPFYPSITFDPAIQPIDITSDFIGNSDGEQMGFLARIIYAWFSQTLAIHGCAWFYSQSEFSPEFYVAGGVAGLGTCFRFLFCMSILFLLLSKKNTTFWIALFILISSNLAPLKYIGYNRYFPQMWALPFLALFNFFYAFQINFSNTWWHRFRRCAFFGVCLFLLPIFLRTLAYQTRQLILESERQTVLQHLKGQSFKLAPEDNTFTIRSRLLADAITVNPNATQLDVNQKDILFGKDAETKAHTLRKQIPICDTPQQLLTFPWHKLLGNIPKPIFDTPPLK